MNVDTPIKWKFLFPLKLDMRVESVRYEKQFVRFEPNCIDLFLMQTHNIMSL